RHDRRRPAAGAARMMLVVLLAVPLAGALTLAAMSDAARRIVHGATAALTLLAGALVVGQVVTDGAVTALGAALRADALSAFMVAIVALVAALAAFEAARESHAGERWFLPLFHLFVFTMLAAVTTN